MQLVFRPVIGLVQFHLNFAKVYFFVRRKINEVDLRFFLKFF